MKRIMYAILPFLLWSFCVILTSCRPQCEVIDLPAGHRDTLRHSYGEEDEVSTVILPANAVWIIQPEGADLVYSQHDRSGVVDLVIKYYCRGVPNIRPGPYENNMHDYRGESMTRKLDDGSPYTWRFVKHICSPLGGWYGVFQYDALLVGDSIYRQDYWAIQEVPDRKMVVEIEGRFGTKEEQEKLRQEAFQIIASLEWLTANRPMGCE